MDLSNYKVGYRDEQGRPMGVFFNMPEGEYHAIKAFSYSGSKEFAKSPAHFQAYCKKEWETDPDREKYKAVHLLCLEPEQQERIVVKDGVWRDELKKEVARLRSEGKVVLKSKDLEDAKKISQKILSHSLAGEILKQSKCEVSIFWEEDGVYCKARIDVLSITPSGICLGDIKNFGSIESEGIIGFQIGRQKYFWQMAWYSRAIEMGFGQPPIARYWIFVEDSEPFGVKVRKCTDPMVEAGWLAISQLLPSFKECTEENVWPGYSEDEADAKMPDMFYGVVGGVDDEY